MININTINKLESLGVGSNIDKFEILIKNMILSDSLGNSMVDVDTEYDNVDILKEIKPTSTVLKSDWIPEYSVKDSRLKYISRFNGNKIDEIDRKSIENILDDNAESNNIFAIALPDGIDIKIFYVNGIFYRSYTYWNDSLGKDITDYIIDKVPYTIYDITNEGVVEIQARLHAVDENNEIINECSVNKVINYIANDVDKKASEKIEILVYKRYMCDYNDEDTLWDEYDELADAGFNTASNVIVRDIDRVGLVKAVRDIVQYFTDKDTNIKEIIISNDNKTAESLVIDIRKIKNICTGVSITGIECKTTSEKIEVYLKIKPISIGDTKIDKIKIDNIDDLSKINRDNTLKINIDSDNKIRIIE